VAYATRAEGRRGNVGRNDKNPKKIESTLIRTEAAAGTNKRKEIGSPSFSMPS